MELIFIACLIGQPASCRETAIPISLEPSLQIDCMRAGMMQLPKWAADHPSYEIKGAWTCARRGSRGRDI